MSVKVRISDGHVGAFEANVTAIGQLVVGNAAFDDTKFMSLDTPNIGFNFYTPRDQMRFVITGIYMKADRQVSSVANAEVIVYESDGDISVKVLKILHQEAMIRGDRAQIAPLNIGVTAGRWVNAKTDDANVHITITGYYARMQ